MEDATTTNETMTETAPPVLPYPEEPIEEWSFAMLRIRAKELRIEGFASLDHAGLVSAIKRAHEGFPALGEKPDLRFNDDGVIVEEIEAVAADKLRRIVSLDVQIAAKRDEIAATRARWSKTMQDARKTLRCAIEGKDPAEEGSEKKLTAKAQLALISSAWQTLEESEAGRKSELAPMLDDLTALTKRHRHELQTTKQLDLHFEDPS